MTRWKDIRVLEPGDPGYPLTPTQRLYHTTSTPTIFKTLRPGAFVSPGFYHPSYIPEDGRKDRVLEYKLRELPRLLNLDSWVGETANQRFARVVNPLMYAAGVRPMFEKDDGSMTFSRTQHAQFLATQELPFDGWVSMGEVAFFDPRRFLRYRKAHLNPVKRSANRNANPFYWESHKVRRELAGLRRPVRRLGGIFG